MRMLAEGRGLHPNRDHVQLNTKENRQTFSVSTEVGPLNLSVSSMFVNLSSRSEVAHLEHAEAHQTGTPFSACKLRVFGAPSARSVCCAIYVEGPVPVPMMLSLATCVKAVSPICKPKVTTNLYTCPPTFIEMKQV